MRLFKSMEVKLYILKTAYIKEHFSSFLLHINGEQIKKYKSFTNENDQLLSVGSSYLQNMYTNNNEIHFNEFGKPLKKGIYFNVSHKDECVVLLTSHMHDVGVDIEQIKGEYNDELARYISSDEEYNFINKDLTNFYRLWVSKESLSKCQGEGVKIPLRDIPGLPLSGPMKYRNEDYYSKEFKYQNYIISLTVKDKNDFNFVLKVLV